MFELNTVNYLLTDINKKKLLIDLYFTGIFRYGSRFRGIEGKKDDAWMEQHIYIIKKWLDSAVFATPTSPQMDRPKIRIFGICNHFFLVLKW